MLNIITGLPGNGKTLNTLKEVHEEHSGKRPIYYNGIDELTLDGWEKFDDAGKWFELPEGSVVVIDESQRTFPPRRQGAEVPEKVSQFETHRHKGFDVYLVTQDAMLLDSSVRRLCGRHIHYFRAMGFERTRRTEWEGVHDPKKDLYKATSRQNIRLDKKYYGTYKSATVHTVIKRIPKKLVILPILFCAMIAVIFIGVSFISPSDDTQLSASDDYQSGEIDSEFIPIGDSNLEPEYTYLEARTPRLPDFPHTAPIYDSVTEPVVAPIPICISSERACLCQTQQNTTIDMDESTCRNIASHGYFISWNREGVREREGEDRASDPSNNNTALARVRRALEIRTSMYEQGML